MAAGSLPEPGTQYGPCVPTCKHIDCAATRATAGAPCRLCNEVIGYERAFYHERAESKSVVEARDSFVHAVCAETEVEEQRRIRL